MAYRKLIEQCWSQLPDERPLFDEIVEELETNKEFITDSVDENEFLDYVDFIHNSRISFDKNNQLIHFEDFIKNQGRNHIISKVTLNQNNEEQLNDVKNKHNESFENKTNLMQPKINENEQEEQRNDKKLREMIKKSSNATKKL